MGKDADDMAGRPAEHQLVPDGILKRGFAFWGAAILLSAVDLGVFSVLAAGPLDAETMRTRLGLVPDTAAEFLDALVSLGLLEIRAGRYANSPETDLFLDRAKPNYIGGSLAMARAGMREMVDLTRRLKARPVADTYGIHEMPLAGDDTHIIRAGSRQNLAALFADLACIRC